MVPEAYNVSMAHYHLYIWTLNRLELDNLLLQLSIGGNYPESLCRNMDSIHVEMYPAQSEPKGGASTPHLYTGGLVAVLFITAIIWDDYPSTEPYMTALSATAGIVSFSGLWKYYPRVGGTAAMFSVSSVLSCLVFNEVWSGVDPRLHGLAMVCTLIALDDCINHTTEVFTPLWFLIRSVERT